MAKSTYDKIQDILMEARLTTGQKGKGLTLTPEERRAMQHLNSVNDWEGMFETIEDFEKFLRS